MLNAEIGKEVTTVTNYLKTMKPGSFSSVSTIRHVTTFRREEIIISIWALNHGTLSTHGLLNSVSGFTEATCSSTQCG